MMNYYYEGVYITHPCLDDAVERYDIFSPNGEKIAVATTEENANLIVTLMNGGQ